MAPRKGSVPHNILPIGTKRIVVFRGVPYYKIKTTEHMKRWSYLHRFLMECELARKLTKEEIVHHKDRDTLNNDLNNLEVMTRKEHNILHFTGVKHNKQTTAKGEKNGSAKLTSSDVILIRKLLKETILSQRKIGIMFGVTRHAVSRIHNKTGWRHI